MPQLEIEKRYLIASDDIEKILRNDFIEFTKEKLEQFYLVATIEKTLRYRKEGKSYFKTSKKGSGLVREEIEEEVSKEEYEEAKKRCSGGIIQKIRYHFTIDNYNFELDIFKGKLKGLRILEVEFSNIEEANCFKMPEILEPLIIKEITNETIYSNGALSRSMQIPLRADAKLSYKQIVESESKKLPQFDIYISKYENGKNALKYTLKRLLISIEYQIECFLENNSIAHIMVANRALNRYRALLKAFKKYIQNDSYLDHLYAIDSLLLLFEKSLSQEKSFRKLLQCKRNYPISKQNNVLQAAIQIAQLRKMSKEELLRSNLLQMVTEIKELKLKTKKSLEKPFEYITYRVIKQEKRELKKLLREKVDPKLLYYRLKAYKHLLQFAHKKEMQNIGYKRLKKIALAKEYRKVIQKSSSDIAKEFLFYCSPKVRINKIYKLIAKEL